MKTLERFVASLAIVMVCRGAVGAEMVGKVLLLEGKADAVQAAKTRALARQAGVENADVVKTAIASSLQIGFRDSTTCTLGALSELSIDEYRYSRQAADATFGASLKAGSVRVVTGNIVKKAPRRFTITTPRASIGIRGCLVQILTGPKEDRVLIFEIGKDRSIEVVSKDGKSKETITKPCLVIIGEHGITVQDLPDSSYREGNASLQIAQNGFGDAGSSPNAGYGLHNLNDNTDYLIQNADIQEIVSAVSPASDSPTEPTYADIDTLIQQAGANNLSLLSAGGGSLVVTLPSGSTGGDSSTVTAAIGYGDYTLNFNSSRVDIGGSTRLSNGSMFSLGFGTDYSAIKNGSFSLTSATGGDSYFQQNPNSAALPISSGSMTLGSTKGNIDTLTGNLNFSENGSPINVRLNTGLSTK